MENKNYQYSFPKSVKGRREMMKALLTGRRTIEDYRIRQDGYEITMCLTPEEAAACRAKREQDALLRDELGQPPINYVEITLVL
jgi:hypothetical protein